MDFSREYHAQHPEVQAFIYGHIHIARYNEPQGNMPPIIFLGEWISLCSYLVLDADGNFSLKYYEEK